MWNRVVLCHSPSAGRSDVGKAEILDALEFAGIDATYCPTDSNAFPAILDSSLDLVIAAGGDGTVGKVAKHIAGRNVPMGVLPVGTANNIARSFGIYGSPHEIAESWRRSSSIACDIGRVAHGGRETLLIEGAGIGPFSIAIKAKAGGGYSGVKKLLAARENLRARISEAEEFDAKIIIDGRSQTETPILGAEIMNIAYAGPGLAMLPVHGLQQGQLRTVLFRARDRAKLLAWLKAPQMFCPPIAPLNGATVEILWKNALLHIDDNVPEADSVATAHEQSATIRLDGTHVKLLIPVYNSPAEM